MIFGVLSPGHPLNALGPVALAVLGGAGVLIILAALVALARREGRPRLELLGFILIGLLALESSLLLMQVQSKRIRGEITGQLYTYRRYDHDQRLWALVGAVGAPVLSAVAAVVLWGNPRRVREEELDYRMKEGLRHYFRNDNAAALIEFTAAVKLAPDRADPYCKRGIVFERMGEYDLALADLERALARDPNMADAHLHRGIVRTARGEYDPALADFDQAAHLRPFDAECVLQRGICLTKKGATLEAIAEFEKVLRKTNHPDYAEPALHYLHTLGAGAPSSPKAEPLGPGV